MIVNSEFHLVLAYIDPGTGSYLIQLLIASILGGLFALKVYWRKLLVFFSNKFNRSKES
ncbi:MAG: hypothetical protein P8X47_06820 [Ignavibacteriaceae bacterium]